MEEAPRAHCVNNIRESQQLGSGHSTETAYMEGRGGGGKHEHDALDPKKYYSTTSCVKAASGQSKPPRRWCASGAGGCFDLT